MPIRPYETVAEPTDSSIPPNRKPAPDVFGGAAVDVVLMDDGVTGRWRQLSAGQRFHLEGNTLSVISTPVLPAVNSSVILQQRRVCLCTRRQPDHHRKLQ